jgi:pimeloyl-ACP methyl ester carboxylesterase
MSGIESQDWTFGGTWPYEPRWFTTSDGIRIHYVDEGPRDAEPVIMVHGNPTWGYLYRNFIRALTAEGFRAVAHDEMGFGRSEKPDDESAYTIQRHSQQFGELMDELSLDGLTIVIQDWGGPIALAWAVDHPDRIRRLVVFNTFTGKVPPGLDKIPLPFRLLRAKGSGELLVKRLNFFTNIILFRGGVLHRDRLGPNEKAAYRAPHPTPASRTGVLAYPRLIPWDEGNPTRSLGEHVDANFERLRNKPALVCWPVKDPAFGKGIGVWERMLPNGEFHEIEASHFIQEDAHERMLPLMIDFLRRT